jgi:hypothetical protein
MVKRVDEPQSLVEEPLRARRTRRDRIMEIAESLKKRSDSGIGIPL